jgi:hypothetical protein
VVDRGGFSQLLVESVLLFTQVGACTEIIRDTENILACSCLLESMVTHSRSAGGALRDDFPDLICPNQNVGL